MENKLSGLNESLNDPSISADYEKLMEVTSSISTGEAALEALYEEWENLQLALEAQTEG